MLFNNSFFTEQMTSQTELNISFLKCPIFPYSLLSVKQQTVTNLIICFLMFSVRIECVVLPVHLCLEIKSILSTVQLQMKIYKQPCITLFALCDVCEWLILVLICFNVHCCVARVTEVILALKATRYCCFPSTVHFDMCFKQFKVWTSQSCCFLYVWLYVF